MRNCLVLGSRRSGSSMVVGALSCAGYHIGEAQLSPHGDELDAINDELLLEHISLGDRHRYVDRRLAIPNASAEGPMPAALEDKARAALSATPWCFVDSRFCFTLDAWRPLIDDAALVCTFRHPSVAATSMVDEAGRSIDLDHAFALWTATYRAILDKQAGEGDWLFLHHDQLQTEAGRARLSEFVGATIDRSLPIADAASPGGPAEAPESALELYAELCARASYRDDEGIHAALAVAVIAFVHDGEESLVPRLIRNVRSQRGVATRLVLIDSTSGGALATRCNTVGAVVLPRASVSRGRSLRAAVLTCDEPFIALAHPACQSLPSHLAHSVDALGEGIEIVTCDYLLADARNRFVDRSSPDQMGGAPGPFWEAGLVAQREALQSLVQGAFYPSELEVLRRLRAAGRAAHLSDAGFFAQLRDYENAFARAMDDATLLTLQTDRTAPEIVALTVCIASEGEASLDACIESFARQLVPTGTHEIVVVHDARSSSAAERVAADRVDCAVSVRHIHATAPDRHARLNTAMSIARGEFVLLTSAATIAAPGLVEAHLHAQRRRFGTPVAVMGTIEPDASRHTALAEHLARRAAGGNPQRDAHDFRVGNVSVPLDAACHAGGFDESLGAGAEIDFALRLDALGVDFVAARGAHATSAVVPSFAELRARTVATARAEIGLSLQHPEAARRFGTVDATAALEVDGALVALEHAIEEFGRVDVGALAQLEGTYAELATEVLGHVDAELPTLEAAWRRRGHALGLRDRGLETLDGIFAAGAGRWPISSEATVRLLAWPDWTDPQALHELMRRVRPLASEPFAALLLCFDTRVDGERDAAIANLQRAFTAQLPGDATLEVVLEESSLGPNEIVRLGRSVDAVLPLGCEPEGFFRLVAAEPLRSAAEVARWRDRFREVENASNDTRDSMCALPELTVIVSTCDRPVALRTLLGRLTQQDLDPSRFEVLVVDDGSTEPIASSIPSRSFPFSLRILRQPLGGSAQARNLALQHASAELVLFLDDDVLPASDVLRRHVEAQRRSGAPCAVAGALPLAKRHCAHSLGALVGGTDTRSARGELRRGVLHDGLCFETGHISVPRSALRAVGGFDTALPYGEGAGWDLGLRLEREAGIRVLFDPAIVCERDRPSSAAALVERARVLGWMAHQVQAKHGDLELLPVPAWPLDDEGWTMLGAKLEQHADECARIVRSIAALSEKELREGSGPVAVESVRGPIATARDIALLQGALLAKRGARPRDDQAASEFELPTATAFTPAATGTGG